MSHQSTVDRPISESMAVISPDVFYFDIETHVIVPLVKISVKVNSDVSRKLF